MRQKLFLVVSIMLVFLIIACQNQTSQEGKTIQTDIGKIKIKGKYTESDLDQFIKFYKSLKEAAEKEDLEMSISFFAPEFEKIAGIKIDELKENTAAVYRDYDNIKYTTSNVKIIITGNSALTIDDYEYKADPTIKGLKPLHYKGKEKIYWKKTGDKWQIINWIYE